jgi:hypothetical protein
MGLSKSPRRLETVSCIFFNKMKAQPTINPTGRDKAVKCNINYCKIVNYLEDDIAKLNFDDVDEEPFLWPTIPTLEVRMCRRWKPCKMSISGPGVSAWERKRSKSRCRCRLCWRFDHRQSRHLNDDELWHLMGLIDPYLATDDCRGWRTWYIARERDVSWVDKFRLIHRGVVRASGQMISLNANHTKYAQRMASAVYVPRQSDQVRRLISPADFDEFYERKIEGELSRQKHLASKKSQRKAMRLKRRKTKSKLFDREFFNARGELAIGQMFGGEDGDMNIGRMFGDEDEDDNGAVGPPVMEEDLPDLDDMHALPFSDSTLAVHIGRRWRPIDKRYRPFANLREHAFSLMSNQARAEWCTGVDAIGEMAARYIVFWNYIRPSMLNNIEKGKHLAMIKDYLATFVLFTPRGELSITTAMRSFADGADWILHNVRQIIAAGVDYVVTMYRGFDGYQYLRAGKNLIVRFKGKIIACFNGLRFPWFHKLDEAQDVPINPQNIEILNNMMKLIFDKDAYIAMESPFYEKLVRLLGCFSLLPFLTYIGLGTYATQFVKWLIGATAAVSVAWFSADLIYEFLTKFIPSLRERDAALLYKDRAGMVTWHNDVGVLIRSSESLLFVNQFCATHPELISPRDQIEYIQGLIVAQVARGRMLYGFAEKTKHGAANIILRKLDQLDASTKNLQLMVEGHTFRSPPMSVMFWGLPGAGKTYATKLAMRTCGHFLRLPLRSAVYHYTMQAFMAAYANQKIFVIDDFGQLPAAKVSPEALDAFIRLNGSLPFFPPMAAIEEKGKVACHPKLVLLTSNYEELNAQGLFSEVGAALRRMKYVVKVEIGQNGDRIYSAYERLVRGNGIVKIHEQNDMDERACEDWLRAATLRHLEENVRYMQLFEEKSVWCAHDVYGQECPLCFPNVILGVNRVVLPMVQVPLPAFPMFHVNWATIFRGSYDIYLLLDVLIEEFIKIAFGYVGVALVAIVDMMQYQYVSGYAMIWSLFVFLMVHSLTIMVADFRLSILGHYLVNRLVSHYTNQYPPTNSERCMFKTINIVCGTSKSILVDVMTIMVPRIIFNEQVRNYVNIQRERAVDDMTEEARRIRDDTMRDLVHRSKSTMRDFAYSKILPTFAGASVLAFFYSQLRSGFNPQSVGEDPPEDAQALYQEWVNRGGVAGVAAPSGTPMTRPPPSNVIKRLSVNAPYNDGRVMKIRRNLCTVRIIGSNQSPTQSTGILGNGFIMMSTHSVLKGRLGVEIIMSDDRRMQYTVDENNIIKQGDLSIITVAHALPSDLDASYFDCPEVLPSGSEIEIFTVEGPISLISQPHKFVNVNGEEFQSLCTYPPVTKAGQSGSPIVLRTKSAYVIVGIHSGVALDKSYSLACPLSAKMKQIMFSPGDIDVGCRLPGINMDPRLGGESAAAIGELAPSSILHHVHYQGNIRFFPIGRLTNFNHRHSSKSQVRKTLLHEHFGWAVPEYEPPNFAPITRADGSWVEPHLVNLACVHGQKVITDSALLTTAKRCVFERYVSFGLDDMMGPLTPQQAINGVPGTNMHVVNLNAAAGYPLQGTKFNHVFGEYGELVPSKEVTRYVNDIYDALDAGQSPTFLFSATLKDEPVKHDKNVAGNIRLFTAGQFATLLVFRQCFGGFFLWCQKHNMDLPPKIGVNATSKEWDKIARILKKFDHIMDSDYKKFDKLMNLLIYAAEVAARVMERSGKYDSFWMKRIWGLVPSLQYYFMEIMGDLILMNGSVPSGVYGTADLNSIAEILFEVMVFLRCYAKFKGCSERWVYEECLKLFPFFIFVYLINYGDDNVKGIMDYVTFFYNAQTIYETALDLGHHLSNADKTGKPSFSSLDKVTFLKRSFRYDEEMEQYVAPLEMKSIMRMLSWRGKIAINEKVHTQTILAEANRQLFLHGRQQLLEFQRRYANVYENFGVVQESFDQMREVYETSTPEKMFITWNI